MYDIENYYNACTVDEAVALLNEHPGAKIIAGGSDVLIRIREGKLAGCDLVCIRDIPELFGVTRMENGIYIVWPQPSAISPMIPWITKIYSVLGDAVDQVGGPLGWNIGTIGGNICNGAVSADSAPTVFSLDAQLRIADSQGVHMVPVRDFYAGPGQVRLSQGQLVTHIVIPHKNYEGYTGHYIKYSMRHAMDIATLGCSVVVKVNPQAGLVEDVRITFGVAAPVPFRCVETEKKLKGCPVNTHLYDLIENSVRQEINPKNPWRASRAFRL